MNSEFFFVIQNVKIIPFPSLLVAQSVLKGISFKSSRFIVCLDSRLLQMKQALK